MEYEVITGGGKPKSFDGHNLDQWFTERVETLGSLGDCFINTSEECSSTVNMHRNL